MTKHINDPPAVEANNEQTERTPKGRALFLDTEFYQSYLDSPDYPDEAKRDFVEALWEIMVGFVDLGFGIHPLQQFEEICGQLEKGNAPPSQRSDEPLKSENTKTGRSAS